MCPRVSHQLASLVSQRNGIVSPLPSHVGTCCVDFDEDSPECLPHCQHLVQTLVKRRMHHKVLLSPATLQDLQCRRSTKVKRKSRFASNAHFHVCFLMFLSMLFVRFLNVESKNLLGNQLRWGSNISASVPPPLCFRAPGRSQKEQNAGKAIPYVENGMDAFVICSVPHPQQCPSSVIIWQDTILFYP